MQRNVVVYAFAASVILALSASPTARKRAEVTAVAGPRYTVRRRPPTRHGRRRIRGGPHGDGAGLAQRRASQPAAGTFSARAWPRPLGEVAMMALPRSAALRSRL
jgi:hypothetical protein